MADWVAWQTVADWVGKLGVGGLGGWFLQRWVGGRDKAADRGRARVAEARPDVLPVDGVFTGDHKASLTLRNRGPGVAFDVRATFSGSVAVIRLTQIESGETVDTRGVDLSDSPFFQQRADAPDEFTLRFRDRFGHEYVVLLPVRQERNAGGWFDPLPEWGRHRVVDPILTKKQLRAIGGA